MFNIIDIIKRHVALRQMARFFSKVERNPVTRTPGEAGLEFEDITFKSDDGVTLKAWYIPAEGSNKLIVFNHFMLGNKAGAAPHPDWGNINVDFMPLYKILVTAGYSVFTYDLRNHGESDVYNNGQLGLTHTEFKDSLASVRYVKDHYRNADIYLYSQCYGTVATMRAMEKSPADFNDIKAFVNIQPLSADAFVDGVTRQFDIAHEDNVAIFSKQLEKRTGYTVDELKVPDLAPAVKVPTLLVQVHKDWRTTSNDIEKVYERLGTADKQLLWIEDETERLEAYNYFVRQPEKLLSWLNAR